MRGFSALRDEPKGALVDSNESWERQLAEYAESVRLFEEGLKTVKELAKGGEASDDFKVAAPVGNLKEVWKCIRKGLKVGPETDADLYLGCKHTKETVKTETGSVESMTYNMEDHLRAIVNDYEDLASQLTNSKHVVKTEVTPHLEDEGKHNLARNILDVNTSDPDYMGSVHGAVCQ